MRCGFSTLPNDGSSILMKELLREFLKETQTLARGNTTVGPISRLVVRQGGASNRSATPSSGRGVEGAFREEHNTIVMRGNTQTFAVSLQLTYDNANSSALRLACTFRPQPGESRLHECQFHASSLHVRV